MFHLFKLFFILVILVDFYSWTAKVTIWWISNEECWGRLNNVHLWVSSFCSKKYDTICVRNIIKLESSSKEKIFKIINCSFTLSLNSGFRIKTFHLENLYMKLRCWDRNGKLLFCTDFFFCEFCDASNFSFFYYRCQ